MVMSNYKQDSIWNTFLESDVELVVQLLTRATSSIWSRSRTRRQACSQWNEKRKATFANRGINLPQKYFSFCSSLPILFILPNFQPHLCQLETIVIQCKFKTWSMFSSGAFLLKVSLALLCDRSHISFTSFTCLIRFFLIFSFLWIIEFT